MNLCSRGRWTANVRAKWMNWKALIRGKRFCRHYWFNHSITLLFYLPFKIFKLCESFLKKNKHE